MRNHPQQPPPRAEILCVAVNGGRDPLPALRAFVAAHGHTFRPGVHQIVVEHESGCRYANGGDCTCSAGPECRIVGLDAGTN
jgi:hypothetical protein